MARPESQIPLGTRTMGVLPVQCWWAAPHWAQRRCGQRAEEAGEEMQEMRRAETGEDASLFGLQAVCPAHGPSLSL
jgi:hypothetical protein